MSLFGPPNVEKLKNKGDVRNLIKALDYRKDATIRRDAAQALVEIGRARDAVQVLRKMNDVRAIEPLVVVLKEASGFVRQAAAEALGQIGDKQAVEPLVAALQDKESVVRQAAAEALGQIGDSQSIEPLIVSLEDKDIKVRRTACMALGQIGDPQAMKSLEPVFKDSDASVRAAAITAQAMIGDTPVMQLATLLKDADELQRDTVVEAFGKIKNLSVMELVSLLEIQHLQVTNGVVEALIRLGEAAVEPLIAAFNKDKKPNVRNSIAMTMGKIGDQRFVDPLIAALKEEDDKSSLTFMHEACAKALGQIGSQRAVPTLIESLRHRSSRVREAAAWSLGFIGDKSAIQPLETARAQAGFANDVQMTAIVTVARIMIEGNSVARLVRLLELEGKNLSVQGQAMRGRAVEALVRIGDAAVEPLIAAVKNKAMPLASRAAAAMALGEIGDPRAVESLITWMNDKTETSTSWWAASVKALGQIGDASAIEALVGALKDRNEYVRRTAAEALGNMGNAAVESLIAALDDDIGTRIRAANALGQIGDTRAVDPLVATLKHEEEHLVEAALNALTSLNWEPTNDIDRAWLAFANKDWNELVSLQGASVGPLLRLARLGTDTGVFNKRFKWGQKGRGSPDIAEKATLALQQVLRREAANVASEDLRAVALLDEAVKIKYSFEDCGGGAGSWKASGTEPIDCSQVRQLARQELIRRGLEA